MPYLFAILTSLFLIVSIIHVLKYSYKRIQSKYLDLFMGLRLLLILNTFLFYAYICFFYLEFNKNHNVNIFGILTTLLILQIIRVILDIAEKKSAGVALNNRLFLRKNMIDLTGNFTIFLGIYLTISLGNDPGMAGVIYNTAGYSLCAFNIFRVFKYRLYDDLYLRSIDKGGSYFGPPSEPAITLLQGLYNVLLRSYVFIVFSFAGIYSLMVGGQLGTTKSDLIFSAKNLNLNNNSFIDLLYFSTITISTVGYGDISPVGEVPKLVCMLEILLGYFFIGAILALITSNYGNGKNHTDNTMRLTETDSDKIRPDSKPRHI